MSNKIKKTMTIKKLIIRVAIIAFVAYIVITSIVLNIDIAKRKEKLAVAQQQIEEQRILNDELEYLLKSSKSSEYLIKMAREKLGYVFPNERVYVDASGK